jgi:signal transduction histidine kinase/ActR/RegA family two-component response regulator
MHDRTPADVNSPLFPVGTRLLAFARELQRAATFVEVLDVARAEVRDAIGFDHAWLFVADEEDAREVRILGYSGSRQDLVWDVAPRIPVTGDPMMEEIFAAEGPVIVEDARTDPRTNKAIVAQLGNRTIVNVPLRLLDRPLGAFGCGTFGDEGVRVPGVAQIEYLVSMCSQIAVAAARIRFAEHRRAAEREKRELETRLYRAQKLESLGLLAGGIAHDFANLLTVILTSSSLASARAQDPLVTEELTAITGAAERGALLTRQLLAISRTHPLTLQAVDLGERLRSLASLLHRILPERIALELSDDGEPPLAQGDPSQLDQVLMNLCINARDAMPDGGVLRIRTEVVPADPDTPVGDNPGPWVAISVTDSGSGMPPHVVERVFEPFFTTKPDRVGTGLGLAVVFSIVRQHNGSITCTSTLGQGTTFRVLLPLAHDRDLFVPLPAFSPRQGTGRILIADDDVDIRETVGRILDSAGYSTLAVADGNDACAAVRTEHFDLAFLDVVMPGPTCHELVKRLRAIRPQLRVLLSSGYAAEADILRLAHEECSGLLVKPFAFAELMRAVRDAMGDAGAAAPASRPV